MGENEMKPTVIVYIDGFNMYRRLVEKTPYKWLNVAAMCDMLLPEYEVIKVKYFTANVSSEPHDPDQPMRQQMYFRALKTETRVELIFGKFDARPRWFPAYPWKYKKNGDTFMRRIFLAKEKGSDVNLASHLVRDSLRGYADAYVIATSDSDQVGPLEMLLDENVGILGAIVTTNSKSKEILGLNLPLVKTIREGVLASSQFPDQLVDQHGIITKPKSW